MGPYGFILNNLATCVICTKANICVYLAKWTGLLILIVLAIGSIGFAVAGVLIAYYSLNATNFTTTFLLSIVFDQAGFFVFGIWNWILYSWEGFLIFPSLPIGEKGFPQKNCPLLNKCPLNILLGMYQMGGSTYLEDKKKFQELYPGRIAIDRAPTSSTPSSHV